MNCNFCEGVAHPATGCVYGPNTIACASCTKEFWKWVRSHTGSKGSKKNQRFEGMISFYEAATLHKGADK